MARDPVTAPEQPEPWWANLPEAGPDDWETCPKCGNMDGGCPFCGHGFIPKEGFQWPKK